MKKIKYKKFSGKNDSYYENGDRYKAEIYVQRDCLKDMNQGVAALPCYDSSTRSFYLAVLSKDGKDFGVELDNIYQEEGSYTEYIAATNQCSPQIVLGKYVQLDSYVKNGFRLFLLDKSGRACIEIPSGSPEIKNLYVRPFRSYRRAEDLTTICNEALDISSEMSSTLSLKKFLENDPNFSFISREDVAMVAEILTAFFISMYEPIKLVMARVYKTGMEHRILIRSDGRLRVSFLEKGGNRKFSGTDVDTQDEFEENAFFMFQEGYSGCLKEIHRLSRWHRDRFITLFKKVLQKLVSVPDSPVNKVFYVIICILWKEDYCGIGYGYKAICGDGVVELVMNPGHTAATIEGLTISGYDSKTTEMLEGIMKSYGLLE